MPCLGTCVLRAGGKLVHPPEEASSGAETQLAFRGVCARDAACRDPGLAPVLLRAVLCLAGGLTWAGGAPATVSQLEKPPTDPGSRGLFLGLEFFLSEQPGNQNNDCHNSTRVTLEDTCPFSGLFAEVLSKCEWCKPNR